MVVVRAELACDRDDVAAEALFRSNRSSTWFYARDCDGGAKEPALDAETYTSTCQ